LSERRAPPSTRTFGPGLLAATSNNDPTTVATLAIVGATTGYGLCWLVVLIVPMLAFVQTLAADVGAVCGSSLQGAIRREYGLAWAVVVLVGIVLVNTLTLAADVKAGSEALSLLTHVPAPLFILPFAALAAWLLLSKNYRTVERYLLAVSIVFVLYIVSAVLSHVDVPLLVRSIVFPRFDHSPAYVSGAIALLGTTLTAYVYVWESIGVAEQGTGRTSLRSFERDAAVGMLLIGVIFLAILVTSAATLGRGTVSVATAADMANALRPLAGEWAGDVFGLALLASAILAVPILASVNAYVAAHTFGWRGSLDAEVGTARAFYGVIVVSLVVAAGVALAPISTIGLLYESSIAGGIATPLSLAFLMLVAGNRTLMGAQRMSWVRALCGWSITATVAVVVAVYLISGG
jgi:Mn2+/Fe2+ NRAMP family transporter